MNIKTGGRSNLTQDRITVAHGSFSRIRHVAPMCTRSNKPTWFLGPTCMSRPHKQHLDRFSRFCKANWCRKHDAQTTLRYVTTSIAIAHIEHRSQCWQRRLKLHNNDSFYRATLRRRGISCRRVSVCPSVCLSQAVLYQNG